MREPSLLGLCVAVGLMAAVMAVFALWLDGTQWSIRRDHVRCLRICAERSVQSAAPQASYDFCAREVCN